MRRWTRNLAVAAALAAGCTPAEAPPAALRAPAAATPAAARAAGEAGVKAALAAFFAAARAMDWKRVDALLAPDFQFYTDDAVILDRAAFLKAMESDEMQIHRLEVRDPQVALSGDGTLASVRYQVVLESSVAQKPYNMSSAETVVFRKEGGAWKMTHNHASIHMLK